MHRKEIYRQLADEALERSEKTLRILNSSMYRERLPRADLPYASLWPLSMHQSALITAAERDPKRYLPNLQRLQRTLLAYWDDKHRPPGFDAYPPEPQEQKHLFQRPSTSLRFMALFCHTLCKLSGTGEADISLAQHAS